MGIGILAAMGVVIYTSLESMEVSCEVCMEFGGRTECATVVGRSREEILATATSTACATLAGGMTESIRCGNTPPKSINCRDR